MKTFDIYAYKELELYGSAMPETEDDLLQIKQLGIDIIVSFDEGIREHPNYEKLKTDFEHYELIITDYVDLHVKTTVNSLDDLNEQIIITTPEIIEINFPKLEIYKKSYARML